VSGLEELWNSSFKWIVANPIFSGILAFLIGGVGVYAKTVVQTIAKQQTEKFLSPAVIEEEVFDEPTGSLLVNRTNEVLNDLTADDLINLYGEKNTPFHIKIGSTDWSFAASRILDPIGCGSVREQKITIKYSEEWFELDHELNWLTRDRLKALEEAVKGEQLFNGDPFRIISIREVQGNREIEVGRCKYFDSLRTSFSLDFVLPREGKSLREILHGGKGTFGKLGNDRLPNHMGLVVIIETVDGQIVAQERSSKVQIRPGTLSASVSGTFEKNDLVTGLNSVELVDALGGVVREMHGELGGQYSYDPANFYFMGLMREFRRGGFPDLYFHYQSPYTFDEILSNSKQAEEVFEVENVTGFYVGSQRVIENFEGEKDDFDRRVNKLLRDIEGRANLTLSLGIGLFYEMTVRRAFSS
jgi:hypothetical protein